MELEPENKRNEAALGEPADISGADTDHQGGNTSEEN